jgi:hypothetical protein
VHVDPRPYKKTHKSRSFGLGSRLAAPTRGPKALARRPHTPGILASRASAKGRDSAAVKEPDGRQIDAAPACRLLNPLDPLGRRCPHRRSHRPRSLARAQPRRPTTRTAARLRLPHPRPCPGAQNESKTKRMMAKTKHQPWLQFERAPPSGLSRQLRGDLDRPRRPCHLRGRCERPKRRCRRPFGAESPQKPK